MRSTGVFRRAFTLMEMLIALALISIVTAIVVVSAGDLLDTAQRPSPFEILRKAMDTAWYSAATGHGELILSYDEDAGALVLHGVAGDARAVFSFEGTEVGGVRFLRAPDMSGGALQVTASDPFQHLVFSPWGGVTPAIIEMDIGKERYRYAVETFSGAVEAVK